MTMIMTMFKVNIHEAKANLSKYIEAAARGETVIICHRNLPVAELRGLPHPLKKSRPIGLARGELKIPPRFFEPLPEEIVTAFRGGS
ncbi:MAG TPA: type II toxin-antitoxin system prevent-host-death family antitoxin [Polyangia bacterium]|nr:type II toxin-antitoxin system prevent-host-death family antitoxin [Polyangia bacterium]